jgi:hypothetical protein
VALPLNDAFFPLWTIWLFVLTNMISSGVFFEFLYMRGFGIDQFGTFDIHFLMNGLLLMVLYVL